MAKRCSPCLGSDIKETLYGLEDPTLDKILDKLPTCDSPTGMELCGGGKRGGGVKRPPNAYQLFTGQCLRDKHLTKFDPSALKDCARQWREMKGK